MSERVACPHCGKQFAARPEMLGRRVRCTGCKTPFVAEELELNLADLEPATFGMAPAAAQAPPMMTQTVAPPRLRAKRVLSPEERQVQGVSRQQAISIGRFMLVVGVLSLLLPLAGLQFRWINELGYAPGAVSLVLLALGGTFYALGATDAGGRFFVHFLKWAKRIALTVLVVLGLVLGIAIANILMPKSSPSTPAATSSPPEPTWRPPTASPPSFMPAQASGPMVRPPADTLNSGAPAVDGGASPAGAAPLEPGANILRQMVLTPDGHFVGGDLVLPTGAARVPQNVKVPFRADFVVKTDSTNIRIDYARGMVIFNWEMSPKVLRYHDPAQFNILSFEGKGLVPANEFVQISWLVTREGSTILVNGEERARIPADYRNLSGALSIHPANGSHITVRSVSITPIQ